MSHKFFISTITSALSLLSLSASAGSWELNDVTYLLPLPTQILQSASINAQEVAGGNALIPRDFFAKAGGTDFTTGDIIPRTSGFDSYENLFVVGVRIDPCFRDHFADACRHQIRMVWQPVDHWADNQPITVDATVHTFYDLSENEFNALLGQLQLIKGEYRVNTGHLPLSLHPGFSKTGATEFQKAFKQTLLGYVDLKHLSRIAIATIGAFELGWTMFSNNFDGKTFTPVQIFNNQTGQQRIKNPGGLNLDLATGTTADITARALQYFSTTDIHSSEHASCAYVSSTGALDPVEQGDQLFAVLKNSNRVTDPKSGNQIAQTYLSRAVRIENPAMNLPGTIDCLSCHSATMVKVITSRALGLPLPRVIATTANVQNTSKYYGDTHNLRMLGYVDSDIQLGDRVIHESAAVADRLNSGQ